MTDRHRFVAGMAAKYSTRLRRFLRLRTSNAADVPDLAQEVFLQLLRVPNHEEIRSPEAYLFTVASHLVQQHHQRQSVAPISLEWVERFNEQLTSPEDLAAQAELSQRLAGLEQKLDQMPARRAMVLLMHRVAGYTIQEIARELEVAEITVKKDLAKALLQCRTTAPEASRE